MYEQSSILKPELVAETYDLMPFEITTQTIERTLADKVFALCDYYMDGKMERHSRHLYDIHKIVESVGISGELSSLIPEVRTVQKHVTKMRKRTLEIQVYFFEKIRNKIRHFSLTI